MGKGPKVGKTAKSGTLGPFYQGKIVTLGLFGAPTLGGYPLQLHDQLGGPL